MLPLLIQYNRNPVQLFIPFGVVVFGLLIVYIKAKKDFPHNKTINKMNKKILILALVSLFAVSCSNTQPEDDEEQTTPPPPPESQVKTDTTRIDSVNVNPGN